MSVTPTSPTVPVVSLENLLFDFPGADVTLRSCDSYEFRVLKTYIFHSSPILGESVLDAEFPQSGTATLMDTAVTGTSLPVVLLPESGAILFSLLTYIFPVKSILPSTVEQVMELLSAAEKYKMDAVLTHIRNSLAQQDPPFFREENSLYIYSLAQKHGLRHEVLQAARSMLTLPKLTIEDLNEELKYLLGVFLHKLWNYHHTFQENFNDDLRCIILLRALATFELPCREVPTGRLAFLEPESWLDQYISSLGGSPSLFGLSGFRMALEGHVQGTQSRGSGCPSCATISSKTILEFWAALSAVHQDSITKAESHLLRVEEETNFEGRPESLPEGYSPEFRCTDMADVDVIIQSCDFVNFRVRRSILATSSPFFCDLFSLPQPPDHKVVDGLPVVHLPEDAEVLDSLIPWLYHHLPELPKSDDKILTLLAACRKYDMTTIQSSIRAEVSRRGLLSPTDAEAFHLFAVAYRKRLIPEAKAAARLTLGYPMTFWFLGETLKSFEGCALFDLSCFHRHCRDGITSCAKVFLDGCSGPSKVWVSCPTPRYPKQNPPGKDGGELPYWFDDVAAEIFETMFACPLAKPSSFHEIYLEALRNHISEDNCLFCMKTHTLKGEEFCVEIENQMTQAWDKLLIFN